MEPSSQSVTLAINGRQIRAGSSLAVVRGKTKRKRAHLD